MGGRGRENRKEMTRKSREKRKSRGQKRADGTETGWEG